MAFKKVINGLQGEPYLTRYHLTPMTRWGQLMLHVFHASDPGREPHDHPFDFVSLVLWGRYREHQYHVHYRDYNQFWLDQCCWDMNGTIRRPPSVARRCCRDIHRVTLLGGKRCVTLVWRSRYKRLHEDGSPEWGFYLNDGTFVPHEEYHRGGPGRGGPDQAETGAGGEPV